MSSDSDSDILQDFSPPKSSMPQNKNIKLKSSSKKNLNSSLQHHNKRKLNKIKEENSNFLNSQASIHNNDKSNIRSLLYDPKLVNMQ
jgi:hypothetical protein